MEDKRIVALFWKRDERALTVVREKYGKFCRRIAYDLLGNDEDTEECENDVYLAAWNAIPPARPQSLSAYLGRIARNVAFNRFDARTAQKRGGETALLLSELGEVTATGSVEEATSMVRAECEYLKDTGVLAEDYALLSAKLVYNTHSVSSFRAPHYRFLVTTSEEWGAKALREETGMTSFYEIVFCAVPAEHWSPDTDDLLVTQR